MPFPDTHSPRQPLSVAVIGSGISGLSASWLLSQAHRVTLYEKAERLGGHTNTVEVNVGGESIPVDTGFIVFNERTYPNLCALFETIGVESVWSDMSFSVSAEGGRFEYSGSHLNGLLASRRNIVRPRFWSMIRDLLRFYKEAPIDAQKSDWSGASLGDYLSANGYGTPFSKNHIVPMAAAIWSTPGATVDAFPLTSFVDFCMNHGLLSLKDRPRWRTLKGGSKTYIPHLTKNVSEIKTGCGVTAVTRTADGVAVTDISGETHTYDRVLIAGHANEALAVLSEPTPNEERLLGAFRYTDNHAVLHTDTSLMPKRKAAWASWAVMEDREDDQSNLCVSYWMNKLQPLATSTDLFVTLNPTHPVPDAHVHYETQYQHPIFDQTAMDAQKDLWSLQGQGGIWFAGAHFGYGFHEDGLQSGLKAAEELGGLTRPWTRAGMNDRILGLRSDASLAAPRDAA